MPIFLSDENGVVDYRLPYDDYNIYDIIFDSRTIQTFLTTSPSLVDSWLSTTLSESPPNTRLIVGLDIEWRPNTQRYIENRVATLQLCVNRRCLIFQIIHAPFLPNSLISFLSNANNTFVGVGIEGDVEKLLEDYSLRVANFVDLRSLAADVFGDPQMRNAGLKALAERVLNQTVEKPRRITMSKWDNLWLTAEQVKYATVDAFVSFEIGRRLYSNSF
ncbi:Ribonuclease H-like superfamily [Sesbania bispinosa]|nr:Ribonuclease H-like superfamily [Sesbania bispinosa]